MGSPVRSPGASRKRISNRRRDKKVFSRSADKLHPVNVMSGGVMRGGIRL